MQKGLQGVVCVESLKGEHQIWDVISTEAKPHSGKESACSVGDPGSILELGRSPGEGNGNAIPYSCLENSMDRGAWRATVDEVAKSQIP